MCVMIHDHLFATVANFLGIFLINYVIMSSAASVFENYGLLAPTIEDAFLLMDQIFKSPATPLPFFIISLFSSLITDLTLNLSGKGALQALFLIDLPVWVHPLTLKVLAIIPALFCIRNVGSEVIYQLLLLCQVIPAIILLPSVVPLFRASSSHLIMGSFKNSSSVELFVWIAFMGMLVANAVFIIELLAGSNRWIGDLRGIMGIGVRIHVFLLILSFASLGFTMYLLITPIRSSTEGPDMKMRLSECQNKQTNQSGYKENDLVKILYNEGVKSVSNVIPETHCDDSLTEYYIRHPETNVYSELGASRLDHVPSEVTTYVSQTIQTVVGDVFAGGSASLSFLPINGSPEVGEENVRLETNVLPEDDQTNYSTKPLESDTNSSTKLCESKKLMVKGKNVTSGCVEKARPSELARGGRRQLASILDEFWGLFFGYHGKLTEEARAIRGFLLLNTDLESQPYTIKDMADKASAQRSHLHVRVNPAIQTPLSYSSPPMPQKFCLLNHLLILSG